MSKSTNQFIIAHMIFSENRLLEKKIFGITNSCLLINLSLCSVDILTEPVHYHPHSIHRLFLKGVFDQTTDKCKLWHNF